MRRALRVLEYDLAVYRRTWHGSLIVSFVSPILFLAAMGLGLGSLVQRGSGTVGGVSYLRFLAPGLMAATAMQTAAVEMTYPVMGKIKWLRIYEAMLATPLTIVDILRGELAWLTLRLSTVAVAFLVAMSVFGAVHTPLALLAVPAAVLTGLAFGAPILAFAATLQRDAAVAGLQRFVIIPLFLLSGPFFPVDQLPRVFQGIAWVGPLAHGVAVTRGLALDDLGAVAALAHVAVLLAWATGGVVAARWTLTRRLWR